MTILNTEAELSKIIRLSAAKHGIRLWRNNVGAVYTADNRFVRYGLANETNAQNSALKSADLIGIRPILITQEMVGQTLGQFVSIESKKPHEKIKNNTHNTAQKAWANLIQSAGGLAIITNEEIQWDLV